MLLVIILALLLILVVYLIFKKRIEELEDHTYLQPNQNPRPLNQAFLI